MPVTMFGAQRGESSRKLPSSRIERGDVAHVVDLALLVGDGEAGVAAVGGDRREQLRRLADRLRQQAEQVAGRRRSPPSASSATRWQTPLRAVDAGGRRGPPC